MYYSITGVTDAALQNLVKVKGRSVKEMSFLPVCFQARLLDPENV